MEKGLFLKNWEIASIVDAMSDINGRWGLLDNEQEVLEKLKKYVEKVEKEYENESTGS